MQSGSSGYAVFMLVIAGLGCALMAAFGLFAAAWGGFAGGAVGGAGRGESFLPVTFWLLPALSIVAFVLYFFSHKLGVLCAWILCIGSVVTIFFVNLGSCLAGKCTTTNPFLIALGVFILPHIWILVAIAVALTRSAALQRSASIPPAPSGESKTEAT